MEGAVVFAVLKIPSTSEGEDSARRVLHDECGSLQVFRLGHFDGHVAAIDRVFDFLRGGAVLLECRVGVALLLLDFQQNLARGAVGRLLQIGIQCRVDTVSAIHRALEAQSLDDLLPDQLDGVADFKGIRPLHGSQRRGELLLVLFARDESQLAHAPKDEIPRFGGVVGVVEWRERLGALEESRQIGALADCHVGGIFSEIPLRGRFSTIEPAAEIDAVQVVLHDLLLAEIFFDAPGEVELHQFALVGALAKLEGIAGELLGHRAGSLRDAALAPVRYGRAEDAHVIHPVVIVETVVLGSDHGLHEHRGQAVVRNRLTILNEKLPKLAALAVVEDRCRLHLAHLRKVELVGARLVFLREHTEGDPRGEETRTENRKRHPHDFTGVERFVRGPGVLFPTVIFLAYGGESSISPERDQER